MALIILLFIFLPVMFACFVDYLLEKVNTKIEILEKQIEELKKQINL